jgi:hypothetical protein
VEPQQKTFDSVCPALLDFVLLERSRINGPLKSPEITGEQTPKSSLLVSPGWQPAEHVVKNPSLKGRMGGQHVPDELSNGAVQACVLQPLNAQSQEHSSPVEGPIREREAQKAAALFGRQWSRR